MSVFSKCFALVALATLALCGVAPATADELVRFTSAPRLSQANAGQAGTGIEGYLAKPKGDGPFPAVVVLHSCLGMRADRRAIGNMLVGWGYVALFVDDFATRGIRETCSVDFPQGLGDAFGGLSFAGGLPYVDKTRIAALGYSQGAATALQIAALGDAPGFAIPNGLRFKAAATYYPGCGGMPGARLHIPTLILIGADDTVTPAADCARLAQAQPSGETQLVVLPDAGHVFDDPAFKGGQQLLGMWLVYDAKAAAASKPTLRRFLAVELGR